MKVYKDNDENIVKVGDILRSSFGIPPKVIESIVSEEDSKYYCTVINNKKIKPQKCTLDEFVSSFSDFWIKESV